MWVGATYVGVTRVIKRCYLLCSWAFLHSVEAPVALQNRPHCLSYPVTSSWNLFNTKSTGLIFRCNPIVDMNNLLLNIYLHLENPSPFLPLRRLKIRYAYNNRKNTGSGDIVQPTANDSSVYVQHLPLSA